VVRLTCRCGNESTAGTLEDTALLSEHFSVHIGDYAP
jgi:hypothetical protein